MAGRTRIPPRRTSVRVVGAAGRTAAGVPVRRGGPRPPEPADTSARKAAGVVLLGSAVLTFLRPILLQFWVPELKVDTGVFTAVVLQVLLGAALFQGSEGARKLTVWTLALASLAVLGPVAIALIAKAWSWVIVFLFLLFWLSGLLSLVIGEEPPPSRMKAGLVVVVVGWIGCFGSEIWLLRLPDILMWEKLEKMALPHREVDMAADGVRLSLPQGCSEVTFDAEIFEGFTTQHMLTCPDREVFATLDVETPLAVDTLEQFADLSFRRIYPHDESLVELGYREQAVDGVRAVSSEAGWRHEGDPYRARILVWRNGWRYAGLVVWSRESRSEAAGEVYDELVGGLDVKAPLTERMRAIGLEASALCPHLTPRAVEMAVTPILKARPDVAVSPEALFRLAYVQTAKGLGSLSPSDASEMGRLYQAAFDTMPEGERQRLGSWLERVRAGQKTRPAEDRAGAASLSRAFQRLPGRSQERLRVLTQNAIALAQ